MQYITYNEFLPALGVKLAPYRGYNPHVNPGISDEFATVGFRAHSMVHGEFDVNFFERAVLGRATGRVRRRRHRGDRQHQPAQADDPAVGSRSATRTSCSKSGWARCSPRWASEHEYKNDEQIDNTMRSVLFECRSRARPTRLACQTPVVDPQCFSDVTDLGVDDIMRGRDHGMPSYNALRKAYGLAPKTSFTAITGEATDILRPGPHDQRSAHPRLHPAPDKNGKLIDPASPGAQDDAVTGVRRTTLAPRLSAIYGSVGKIDAFVGMVSEKHVPGTEFGQLQLAIWKDQFQKLRDGDKFFYLNDKALPTIIERLRSELPAHALRHHPPRHGRRRPARRVPRNSLRPSGPFRRAQE